MFSSGDLSSDLKPLDNVWFQIIHKLKKTNIFKVLLNYLKPPTLNGTRLTFLSVKGCLQV